MQYKRGMESRRLRGAKVSEKEYWAIETPKGRIVCVTLSEYDKSDAWWKMYREERMGGMYARMSFENYVAVRQIKEGYKAVKLVRASDE